jgi:hypothetical protein
MPNQEVGFALNNGRRQPSLPGLKSADRRLMHRSKQRGHSITWSARASNVGGTVRPDACDVFQVNDQLKFDWLLDGQVSGLTTLEDLLRVAGSAPKTAGLC